MEIWRILILGAPALCALVLGVRLHLLRHAIREAADELDEKLRTDTNTLISISSGDLRAHPSVFAGTAARICRAPDRNHP